MDRKNILDMLKGALSFLDDSLEQDAARAATRRQWVKVNRMRVNALLALAESEDSWQSKAETTEQVLRAELAESKARNAELRKIVADRIVGGPTSEAESEARNAELRKSRDFLQRLAKNGGSIVSSAAMTPGQIAIAQAAERMLVMPDGLGFVYVPGPFAQLEDDGECSVCGGELTCRKDCERQLELKNDRIAELEAEKASAIAGLNGCLTHAEERIAELEADHLTLSERADKAEGCTSFLLDRLCDEQVSTLDRESDPEQWKNHRAQLSGCLERDYASHREEQRARDARINELERRMVAERTLSKNQLEELQRTLRDVTGGDYDLGYSPADTITELREELAAAKAQRDEARKERSAYMEASREWTSSCLDARKERDAAVKRTEEAEAEKKSAADSDYKKRISLTRQIMDLELRWGASNKRLTELTTWRKGAPSEPGWYATRGPNLLAADNWDGVTWLNSHPSESTEHLPIRLDKCAEPAPPSPYASEHKPEDTEDA